MGWNYNWPRRDCKHLRFKLLFLPSSIYFINISSIMDNFNWHSFIKIYLTVLKVFSGLTFKLSLEFPSGYPYTAPTVKFTSACFHPNVDTAGNICLDILKDKWSALLDVRTILISIQSLLGGNVLYSYSVFLFRYGYARN